MHELPITQSILSLVIDTAKKNGGNRVTNIYLMVGDLTSIVDDSIQFYFDILSQGTLAEGATLHIEREHAQAECLDCQHTYEVSPPLDPYCPACDSANLQVSGGREFSIQRIEVAEKGDFD
jgi:hydrogenase nickel incorporation protein HypA/HybF